MKTRKVQWPHGKRFAFSIIDDTDVSTYDSIKPIYDLLEELGFKTTKTVWIEKSKQPSKNFFRSQTMEDKSYAALVRSLNEKGFEIAMHGASMESSQRTDIENAVKKFNDYFGRLPRIHINHAENKDNLYWGVDRFNSNLLRWFYKMVQPASNFRSFGHEENSNHFWGDLCQKNIDYVRNFCYDRVNLLNINPSMPYHNNRCKYVRFWFSSVDAYEPWTFNRLLEEKNIDRLVEENGVSIISTHFGKYFVENGELNRKTKEILSNLAKRGGWYVPASEILDHMRKAREEVEIDRSELIRMEYRWVIYKMIQKIGVCRST